MSLETTINHASCEEIAIFLEENAMAFNPPFNTSVDIESYAAKLVEYAVRFEMRNGDALVALLSAYINSENGVAYIPYICVKKGYEGCNLGQQLFDQFYQYCRLRGVERVELEVRSNNHRAMLFYEKQGFVMRSSNDEKIQLVKIL